MWNRFISSTYAHLITAIALTLGLAAILLTAHPHKSNVARIGASAQSAPSSGSAQGSLMSQTESRNDRAGTATITRVLQDNITSDQSR